MRYAERAMTPARCAGIAAGAVVLVVGLLLMFPSSVVRAATETTVRGEVPVPGGGGWMTVVQDATASEIIDALRAQACEPATLGVLDGSWRLLTVGAPAPANASFPAVVLTGTSLFVRCAASIEVTFPNGDAVLAGTLALPPIRGPYPAVVLVSGSGQQDRDEALPGVPGYRPFRWISEHISALGIAVLRYDDRGTAGSTGRFLGATTADFASDAEAALRFLMARSEIDPTRVGVLGHSEGGVIAAMIGARNSDVAFVISMAGTGVDGAAVLSLQAMRMAAACGADPGAAMTAYDEARRMFRLTLEAKWGEIAASIHEAITAQLAALPEEQRGDITGRDVDALVLGQVQFIASWLRFFLPHDPGDDWARVTVPTLVLHGGLDMQVPADQNGEPIERALAEAGNDDATVVVFPTANHLFQDATTGCLLEYPELPMRFVPGFLDTIGDWLVARFVT